ncbi:MAG TPA: aldo/keto reductase [Opitutaceae bacterium]|nr:aldo/keto reductase [Opitutaceae bacterium]
MIKKRIAGRTGLAISELCLGTLNFGWKTDETTAFAILDAYYAAGGNFVQSTSRSPDLMFPSASSNVSEEIVGRWWKSRGIPRHDLLLTTRIHVSQVAGSENNFIKVVRQAVHDSLRRLQTDYIDMVIFEWNDGLLPIRYTLQAFDQVVRNEWARFIGAANFPAWRTVDALGRAYLRNHCRMEAIQADYSLMTRARFEPEAMALCQEQRLAFFARSPLAGGFFARSREIESPFGSARRDTLLAKFGKSYAETALTAAADVAARHEASSAQVALAWVLQNPVVTSAIIGVRSAKQLSELVHGTRLALTATDLEQLGDATVAEEVRVMPETQRRRFALGEAVLN